MRNLAKFPQKQGNIQQISFCEQTSHKRRRLIGSALKQKKRLKNGFKCVTGKRRIQNGCLS
jgi:hypothetical protein